MPNQIESLTTERAAQDRDREREQERLLMAELDREIQAADGHDRRIAPGPELGERMKLARRLREAQRSAMRRRGSK